MEFVWEIGLQALSIFVLMLGILGLGLSFALLISPRTARWLNNLLSRYISFDKKLTYLNKPIQTETFTYQHHVLTGLSLIGGSAFFLLFLFLRLDIAEVLSYLRGRQYLFLWEIGLESIVLFGKIAGFAGVASGLFLLFVPDVMSRIESRTDAWIGTQGMVDKLEELHLGIDKLVLRFPLLFGFAGLMTSAVLIILSAASLLVQ